MWMEWMVSEGGFSSWFGWESAGIISVVGGCVDSDGCLLIIVGGCLDVFLVWFIIWEISVCGICSGSITGVSDGLGT